MAVELKNGKYWHPSELSKKYGPNILIRWPMRGRVPAPSEKYCEITVGIFEAIFVQICIICTKAHRATNKFGPKFVKGFHSSLKNNQNNGYMFKLFKV